jgi:hypothetical protein
MWHWMAIVKTLHLLTATTLIGSHTAAYFYLMCNRQHPHTLGFVVAQVRKAYHWLLFPLMAIPYASATMMIATDTELSFDTPWTVVAYVAYTMLCGAIINSYALLPKAIKDPSYYRLPMIRLTILTATILIISTLIVRDAVHHATWFYGA